MPDCYIGEILQVAFDFAPRGTVRCDGQSLNAGQYSVLYALIGTTFGGSGRGSSMTFNLPDLRGRVPVHPGDNGIDKQGQKGGVEFVTLEFKNISHTHALRGSTADGNSTVPFNNVTRMGHSLAKVGIVGGTRRNSYGPPQNLKEIAAGHVSAVGGGKAHDNMHPFLVINFVMVLNGVFPMRS